MPEVPNRADHPARKQGDHTTPTAQYALTVHNSNSPTTLHPTVDHAIKQAAFVGHQEGRTNAVGTTIRHTETGVSESHSVAPMNDTEASAHKDAVNMGSYKVKYAD